MLEAVYISVPDQFIFRGAHIFLVRFAWILNPLAESHQRWKPRWAGGGGGGGELVHFFFTAPKSVLYFSIGLGVHEILQVNLQKIIDEQKDNNNTVNKKLQGGGGESCTFFSPRPNQFYILVSV